MEYERYEDVIDAYNSGVGVVQGESLTDYIKRNNIKIKEVEIDNLDNLEGSRPMEKEGVMQLASGNMDIRIEEVVKEFIRRRKRRPRSLQEIKDFYMMEIIKLGNYFTFTIVRHPLDRLISAYRDRILDGCTDQAKLHIPAIFHLTRSNLLTLGTSVLYDKITNCRYVSYF